MNYSKKFPLWDSIEPLKCFPCMQFTSIQKFILECFYTCTFRLCDCIIKSNFADSASIKSCYCRHFSMKYCNFVLFVSGYRFKSISLFSYENLTTMQWINILGVLFIIKIVLCFLLDLVSDFDSKYQKDIKIGGHYFFQIAITDKSFKNKKTWAI